MDDKYDDLIKLSKDIMQVSYKEINGLREQVEGYKKALDDSSTAAQELVSAIDEQLKERASRIRLSIVVGVIAIIAGVLALWGSSSIKAGFFQMLLIATGGALITFCLVELILDKIIEIPSREAGRQRKLVDIYKSQSKEMANINKDLLKRTNEYDAEIDKLLPELKKIAFPNQL
jgi:hypothetical protein